MCDYCNPKKIKPIFSGTRQTTDKLEAFVIKLNENKIKFKYIMLTEETAITDATAEFKILYCPMCGKRLKPIGNINIFDIRHILKNIFK